MTAGSVFAGTRDSIPGARFGRGFRGVGEKMDARRGRAGEVGGEGAVAVGFAAWWVSPELRASIPAMLCYATSRVGRGRGLLGLTPPQPPWSGGKTNGQRDGNASRNGHGETGRIGCITITA